MSFSENQTRDRDQLEASIVLALETAPEVHIPAGFAARVSAQATPVMPASLTRRRYGRRVAIACMGVLLALIFAFARPAAGASPVWSVVEGTLCAQFAVLAVWLVARSFRPFLHWGS